MKIKVTTRVAANAESADIIVNKLQTNCTWIQNVNQYFVSVSSASLTSLYIVSYKRSNIVIIDYLFGKARRQYRYWMPLWTIFCFLFLRACRSLQHPRKLKSSNKFFIERTAKVKQGGGNSNFKHDAFICRLIFWRVLQHWHENDCTQILLQVA